MTEIEVVTRPHPFRVLTLWQPYASLIAHGVKRIETRPLPAPTARIGDRIAIHAAARTRRTDLRLAEQAIATGEMPDEELPFGAIVCTVVIAESLIMLDDSCLRAERDATRHLYLGGLGSLWIRDRAVPRGGSDPDIDVTDQRPYGEWAVGRHAWPLEDVERLAEPAPFRGGQGWSMTWP